jgi:peroxisomal membrane protein 4
MDKFTDYFRNFISLKCELCEHNNCVLSSLQGLRNGFYYGAKIRFIHSLVMEILFSRSQNFSDKIKNIIKPTYEHALNLGLFVIIYKTAVCLLKRVFKSETKLFNFFAGIIGAYFMWSKKSNVNMQIMLYLLSRNILAISKIISEKYMPDFNEGFFITSIVVWGVVMFLFEFQPAALQNSLKNSMDFIYKDSNFYKGWRDLIPFYIPYFNTE